VLELSMCSEQGAIAESCPRRLHKQMRRPGCRAARLAVARCCAAVNACMVLRWRAPRRGRLPCCSPACAAGGAAWGVTARGESAGSSTSLHAAPTFCKRPLQQS